MRNSLLIVGFFIAGIFGGYYSLLPTIILEKDISLYVLYTLMFLVGISIGANRKTWAVIRNARIKIFVVPLTVVFGTFAGVIVSSFFINSVSVRESLAVGAGFGYYSLSSVLIGQLRCEALGVIALMSNITREIITLLFTPFLAHYFGKLAPIASGGATSMDVTLPVITRYVGSEYAIIAVFSGIVLTILVPFLVTFILTV